MAKRLALEPLMDQMRSDQANSLLSTMRRAAAAIMDYYRSGDYAVELKNDGSPVTQADLASHRLLKEALPGFVDAPVLSEEEVPSWPERRSWRTYWLVDPLDGTKEFIHSTGEFTINVALVKDTEPIFGILYVPVNDIVYYAARGLGAFKRTEAANPVVKRLHVRSPEDGHYAIISSHLVDRSRTQRFIAALPNVAQQTAGSAIKFGIVAEGQAHLYPRFAPTYLWDTAPGQCLVEEAGGAVLDPQLQPLRYDPQSTLENSAFIACARRAADWSAVWHKLNTEAPQK